MKTKEYVLASEARNAIEHVASQLGDIVGKTLGPGGRNYLLPSGITNDGKTIAREVEFQNPCHQLIADIFRVVSERTDAEVGDGTTTSLVLSTELAQDTIRRVADINAPTQGQSVMDLSRTLDAEKDKALELLTSHKKDITSLEELEKVAQTSMENETYAKMIAKAVYEGGKDSHLVIEDGFSGTVETDVVSGIKSPFALAIVPPGFREVVLTNLHVAVAMHVFEAYKDLNMLMRGVVDAKNVSGIAIVGKQFSTEFIKEAVAVSREANFPIVLLQNPTIGIEAFEDVAAYVGAKLIDTHPKTGTRISSLSLNDCGRVKKLIAHSKGTVFIEGAGAGEVDDVTTSVTTRVLELRKQLDSEKVEANRAKLQERIAELSGGIVTIRVDAKTPAEKYYLRLKVEDTLHSCKQALAGGMVPGAGITLDAIAEALTPTSLLYTTLKAPRLLIERNLGQSVSTEGVWDAYPVVKRGLENAVSVVKVLMTTEGVVAPADKPTLDEALRAAQRNP